MVNVNKLQTIKLQSEKGVNPGTSPTIWLYLYNSDEAYCIQITFMSLSSENSRLFFCVLYSSFLTYSPLYSSLPFPSSDRVSLIWVPLTSGNSAFPELSAPFTTPSLVARHCTSSLSSCCYNLNVAACSIRLCLKLYMSGHFDKKQMIALHFY